jgi:hypothetical protein
MRKHVVTAVQTHDRHTNKKRKETNIKIKPPRTRTTK